MQMSMVHSNLKVIRAAFELFLMEAHDHILGDSQMFLLQFRECDEYLEFSIQTIPPQLGNRKR